MSETMKSIIDSYHSGLLSTPNIQVLGKKLSDETIKFTSKLMPNQTFYYSTFKNSDLINIEFINGNFGSSYFEKCLVQNCIFENTNLREVEFDGIETIFNDCTFLKSGFGNAIFESCHFVKPMFEGMKGGLIGSAVLIDSKFSNFKKSIEFEGEVYFNEIFDQIDKFYLD